MKLYIVRDSDFSLKEGKPSSYLLNYDSFAKRYRSEFDEVEIVARLFEKDDPSAKPVVGEGVGFTAMPGFRGPAGFLRALPRVIKTVLKTTDRDAAYLLRIPATMPLIYSLLLRLRGIPFAVEVAADPYDGYSKAALNNHRLASFFRFVFVNFTKWQCRNAIASAYVTSEALQRRYPPRDSHSSFSFTSIDLQPEAYVATPRGVTQFNVSVPHVVMVGNMQKNLKGHDTLLEAIALLKARGITIKASIVGFGERRAFFEQLAGELGVADQVVFMGKLQNGPEVRAVLDRADLFILPSRQEGLPRALLEAMARALPAIATRVGGTPELLADEYLLAPDRSGELADKIAALALDPVALGRASQQNLEASRKYGAEIITQRRRQFLRYLADNSGR